MTTTTEAKPAKAGLLTTEDVKYVRDVMTVMKGRAFNPQSKGAAKGQLIYRMTCESARKVRGFNLTFARSVAAKLTAMKPDDVAKLLKQVTPTRKKANLKSAADETESVADDVITGFTSRTVARYFRIETIVDGYTAKRVYDDLRNWDAMLQFEPPDRVSVLNDIGNLIATGTYTDEEDEDEYAARHGLPTVDPIDAFEDD